MSDKKMVPEIRFGGYEDDWKYKKLKDIDVSLKDGNYGAKYPKKNEMSDYRKGVPFLRGNNLSNGKIDTETLNYISPQKNSELTSGHIQSDDIILAVRGSIGALGYARKIHEGWNINSQLALIRTNKSLLLGNFLIQYLLSSKGHKELISHISGSALKQLSLKELINVKVPVCCIREQAQIGSLFQHLDDLIAANQRKGEQLQQLKQALLQKLFPAGDATTPAIRFAGFTDEWEEKRLGDIREITMGQSPSSSNYTDNPEDHILVQGNADIKDGWVKPRVWTTQITKKAYIGDLLISVRAPVGEVAQTKFDVVLGRGVAGIRRGDAFLFQTLAQLKQQGYWNKLSSGSTFESINSSDLKNAEISLPSLEEQKRIGQLLADTDQLLITNELKRVNLKKLKQALMQKMFV